MAVAIETIARIYACFQGGTDGQPSIHQISVIEVQDKANEEKPLLAQVATQEGV